MPRWCSFAVVVVFFSRAALKPQMMVMWNPGRKRALLSEEESP